MHSKPAMDIFLISNMFPTSEDQIFGVFVKNFKTEMEKQGIRFKRTSLIKGKGRSKIEKIYKYFTHYLSIIRQFLRRDYDLIYVHYLTHHIPILILLLPFRRTPVVVNVHGSDAEGAMKRGFLRTWSSYVLKKIDLLIVPTSDFKERVLQTFPFMSQDKIFISPSGGVDPNLFFPGKPIQPNSGSSLTLGFISRLNEQKGWRTFMDALVLLKNKNIAFNALIGGKGPDELQIKKEIQRNGLEEQVQFLGFIPQADLQAIYSRLDLYIFPTHMDSLGLTGIEALSCGIPVIASKIQGGPSTYIQDGVNGYLFQPKNAVALSDKIAEFSELDVRQKERLRIQALASAEPYIRENVASTLAHSLQNLIRR
jgi:glycosyltransferase involved in cell wall biosynthesis